MRVLVLGGTGPSGVLIIRELLAVDHTVVVYARSPDKLPEDILSHRLVIIIKGTFEESDDSSLLKAMEGVHAVLSALGPTTDLKKAPFYPSNTPLATAYTRIISTMHKMDVKRLIALGTASIKDPNDKFNFAFWVLVNGVKTVAYNAYKDVVAIGDTIRGDGKDLLWTIVRVPLLTSADTKEQIAGYVGDGKVTTSLPRAAFAAFVMTELEKNEWVRKAPLVSAP
ncbi:hypothetical protein HWV62_19865 [Athelia sp. TMB]|nr:hypothetical protein HWV62_19865 [Athelia sp. TMB]